MNRDAIDVVQIAPAGADIDLVETYGRAGIALFVASAGSGTLAIRTSTGEDRTLTVTTGYTIDVGITAILAATDVSTIHVAF